MRTPRRRTRGRGGFTLIEVMIAILLTAIATIGIMGLYKVETRAAGFSRHTTEATVLAQDQLELMRSNRFIGTQTDSGINGHGLPEGLPGGIYTRQSTVTSDVGFDLMVVTVDWVEDGEAKTVVMRTRRGQ